MRSTCLKTSRIALAVLCAAFVLTLAAPQAALADSRVQAAETSQEVSGVCPERWPRSHSGDCAHLCALGTSLRVASAAGLSAVGERTVARGEALSLPLLSFSCSSGARVRKGMRMGASPFKTCTGKALVK